MNQTVLELKGQNANKSTSSDTNISDDSYSSTKNSDNQTSNENSNVDNNNTQSQPNNTQSQPNNTNNNPNSNPTPNQQPMPVQTQQVQPPKKKSKLSMWLWITFGVLLLFLILAIISGSNTYYVAYGEFFDALVAGLQSGQDIIVYLDVNNGYYVTVQFTLRDDVAGFDKGTYITYFDSVQAFYTVANNYASNLGIDWSFWINNGSLKATISNPTPGFIYYFFIAWLPWLIVFVIGWILIKKIVERQQSTGKIQKRALTPQISAVKFADVEGYSEIKLELLEIVDFLRQPQKYYLAGARTPKGVLLSGPPGTGKTLFAKAIAGEAGIPFYSISGSDFVEMFVGVGASRVRSLFEQAKKTAPSILFIDELDAVGRSRGAGVGGGNDEREQTLNQLLVEMDGFAPNAGIIVIAATNRPDVLDPALKRPGRFDRSIEIRLPDIKERESILKLHSRKGNKKFSSDVDWINIAMRTPGFSGAELENVINEAAILQIRLNKTEIDLNILDEAIDRVIGGPAKTNNTMSSEEKDIIAHHEAGHALIGLLLKDAEKVQKISIVPRGQAGGYVLMTPKKEKIIQTKAELLAKVISYMGGRVSEEIFFGKDQVTTGAYSDIQEATKIARRMVVEFGMSELGPIQYEKNHNSPFLGGGYPQGYEKRFSESIAYKIDLEVKKIIEDSYEKATKIISGNKDMIKLFAESLRIKEVLNSEDIEYIFKNKKMTTEILNLKDREAKSNKEHNKAK